jgi:hypothetical protein
MVKSPFLIYIDNIAIAVFETNLYCAFPQPTKTNLQKLTRAIFPTPKEEMRNGFLNRFHLRSSKQVSYGLHLFISLPKLVFPDSTKMTRSIHLEANGSPSSEFELNCTPLELQHRSQELTSLLETTCEKIGEASPRSIENTLLAFHQAQNVAATLQVFATLPAMVVGLLCFLLKYHVIVRFFA